ncbi:MAG: hypothetical protein MK161_14070 [Pirellulales bacterium]|nr:hypothetical protein [Pirellulales bacterium]
MKTTSGPPKANCQHIRIYQYSNKGKGDLCDIFAHGLKQLRDTNGAYCIAPWKYADEMDR